MMCMHLGRWTHIIHHILYYATLHTQLCNLKTTLAIDPRTGRVSTASVLQAKNKKRPTKWVKPLLLRGEVERRIGWNKTNVLCLKVTKITKINKNTSNFSASNERLSEENVKLIY